MSFIKAFFNKAKAADSVALTAAAQVAQPQSKAKLHVADSKLPVTESKQEAAKSKRHRNRKPSRLRQFFDSVKQGNGGAIPSVKLSNRVKALERSLAFLDAHVQRKSGVKAAALATAAPVVPPVADTAAAAVAASKLAWKKGTGYGSDHVAAGNVEVYTAAKSMKEDAALSKNLFHLKTNLSKIMHSIKQDEVDVILVLTRSQLLPFLSELLATDSVLEMDRRAKVYHAALDVCQLLAEHASTRVLLLAPVTDCNTQSSLVIATTTAAVSSETKPSDEKKSADEEKSTGKTLVSIRSRLDRLAAKVRFTVEKSRKVKTPIVPVPATAPAATSSAPAASAAPAKAAVPKDAKADKAKAGAKDAAAPAAPVEEEQSVAEHVVEVADFLAAKLQQSVGLSFAIAQKVQQHLTGVVGPTESTDAASVCETTLKLNADQNHSASLTINVEAPSLDLTASTAETSTAAGSNPATSRSVASTPASDCAPLAATPTSVAGSDEEKKSVAAPDYVALMRDVQFAEVPDIANHHFQNSTNANKPVSRGKPSGAAPTTAQWIRRVVGEYADLRESLPLNQESSVFMRVHDENVAFSQMLITGPADTPYANGCFLFDVYLPADYPRVPPKVNLMTTGKGSVRFNPNLYNCGKVCLSLLGTWGGGAGEGWDAKTSTLLQLAVSIQSLIFVPEPYFNEPGYEAQHNGVGVHPQSEAYTRNIEEQTLRWAVLDILKSPPAGFEKIVRNHFFMRQHAVLKDVDRWIARREADANNKGNVEALRLLQTELLAAFKDLKLEA